MLLTEITQEIYRREKLFFIFRGEQFWNKRVISDLRCAMPKKYVCIFQFKYGFVCKNNVSKTHDS